MEKRNPETCEFVKAYYLAGKISREELDLIFRKYGIA